MAAKRAKKRNGKGSDNGERVYDIAADDRLSNLPDEVIHHILSLMPTKSTIQTSVLSRRWERTWASIPTFDAHSSSFQGKASLDNFMDKYFLGHSADAPVTRFNLRTTYRGGKAKLDHWLDSAVSTHVKEFKLRLLSCSVEKKTNVYTLPQAILLRLSSLTLLKLEGLEWPVCTFSSGSFPLLKVLSLKKIYGLNDDLLSSLLSGCPSIEKLLLEYCVDLRNPKVSSSTLKSAEIAPSHSSCSTLTVQIEAANLESLVYDRGFSSRKCDLILTSCASVKFLSISNASIDDSWVEDVVGRLLSLESLVLVNCHMLRHIKISSQSLKRLVLRKIGNCSEKTAKIIAPKLAFFGYFDESLLRLSMTTPTTLEADIQIYDFNLDRKYSQEWYVNLIAFLSALSCCKDMSMHISSEKALIIPMSLRTSNPSPLPTLKHLKVKTTDSLYRTRIFRESLGWISPALETLKIEEKAGYLF